MVATFTSNLRLTKQGDGDNPNTWGDIVNVQVTELIEDAISGVVNIDITGVADVDIDATTANGATDDARNKVLRLTSSGTLGADIELTVPSVEKTYIVDGQWTDTGGPWTVEILPTGGTPGNGVSIDTGEIVIVYTNGTTIKEVSRLPLPTVTTFTTGMIIMWSGTIATIPSGWTLCDGTASTPDLTEKFVIGASVDDSGVAKTIIENAFPGDQSGGSIVTDSSGAHDHGGTVSGTAISIAQMPAHTHLTRGNTGTTALGGVTTNTVGAQIEASGSTGGGATHNHTVTNEAAHTHGLVQPYFALAYIMKT